MTHVVLCVALVALAIAPSPSTAASEQGEILKRYERARELHHAAHHGDMVLNATVYPIWISGSDSFWYERETKTGREYRIVDPVAGSNTPAFDHEAFAKLLQDEVSKPIDHRNLPIENVEITSLPLTLEFDAFDSRYAYDESEGVIRELAKHPNNWIISPDGRLAAFSKSHNLWIRDLETGEERALTADGESEFAYGAPGAAWGITNNDESLQVRWSPDSSTVFTVKRDTRFVKDLPILHHIPGDGSLRPQVENFKVPFPGDEHVETLKLVLIDIKSGAVRDVDYAQIPTTRNGLGLFTMGLAWWGDDNGRAYFVHMDRYYKFVRVVEIDATTGNTRILFEEKSDTHIRLMLNSDDRPALKVLGSTNELLWLSERDGWAHLYLYDLNTGNLKNRITSGEWVVRHVVRVVPEKREVFVQTGGRVKGRDPYYRDLARVDIDTGAMVTLASGDHEYFAAVQTDMQTEFAAIFGKDVLKANAVSRTGAFAVVTRSRADTVPESIVVDRAGAEVLTIERADISGLPPSWIWPEPVELLAADGATDLYGLVFRPSDFSEEKSYPIINYIFNTPDFAFVPKGSFTNNVSIGRTYFHPAALAELGFIVVLTDGRGGPFRGRAFLDQSYGWIEGYSKLEDHVAGIRQLARRYPYMDIDRVAIVSPMGGSGGIFGLLDFPEFYKVGVAAFIQDTRMMPASMFGDMFEAPGSGHENHQYPEALADRLQGKLFVSIGLLDSVTPPAGLFRLVDALQEKNKDFDMLVLPKIGHWMNDYQMRRSWDYLVRNLHGVDPPKEFDLSEDDNKE